MRRLRVLLFGFGLFAAVVHCGPSSSHDEPSSAGADAAGGEDSGSGGSSHSGGPMGSAGDTANGGEPSEVGGTGAELGGHPSQAGGAAGSVDAAGAGGGPPVEPVGPYTIATGQVTPTGIAIDEQYVYWSNRDAGTIVRCPRFGCGDEAPTLLGAELGKPLGVTVDATYVYWIDDNKVEQSSGPGRVYRCLLDGCVGPPTLLTEWTVGNRTNDLHVVGDTLYIAAWPMLGTCSTDGCDDPTSIGLGPYVGVDSNTEYLYAGRYGASALVRCPIAGCGASNADELMLASGVHALAVTVDENDVYFADHDYFSGVAPTKHRIVKCPLAGCGADPPQVIVPDDGVSPYGLTSNATHLYFTNVVQGTVLSIPK